LDYTSSSLSLTHEVAMSLDDEVDINGHTNGGGGVGFWVALNVSDVTPKFKDKSRCTSYMREDQISYI
jgi:hypothetical protein